MSSPNRDDRSIPASDPASPGHPAFPGDLAYPGDPAYPAPLAQLGCRAPARLFLRGRGSWPPRRAVAVVGARALVPYAREVASRIAGSLAARGVCVVSGLARGVDRVAHEAALACGGPTAAVLGTGVDVVYPAEHADLFAHILERGMLVSEMPSGTPPRPRQFPSRNRLVAGLADGVVLVQAGLESGSRHTVRVALELGRWVLVVPARLDDEGFEGNLEWIARRPAGLGVVTDVELPVRIALGLEPPPPHHGRAGDPPDPQAAGLSPEARRVLAALSRRPRDIESVARDAGLDVEPTAALLVELELLGVAARAPGDRYRRGR